MQTKIFKQNINFTKNLALNIFLTQNLYGTLLLLLRFKLELIQKEAENLKLGSAIVLFDRNFGEYFFQDFRGYGNPLDDAEWLLERTTQRSWGFMIRPIAYGERCGLWIGEYAPNSNQIIREETIFSGNSSSISKLLFDYGDHKISEKKLSRKLTLKVCKEKLQESRIIQDFKHYICPSERFYNSCPHVEGIYKTIMEKYGLGAEIHYSMMAEIIANIKPCEDVIICPLLSSPNTFERVINLNKALRSRKLGEIKIIDRSMVKII